MPIQELKIWDSWNFCQRNPQWAHHKMNNTNITLGTDGCMTTVKSNLLGINPDEMNRMLTADKQYQKNSAMAATRDIMRYTAVNGIKYSSFRSIPFPKPVPDSNLQELLTHLYKPLPAMIEVDFKLATEKLETHFVLAVGAIPNAADQELKFSNLIINDPWTGLQTTLLPLYGANLARAIWSYTLYTPIR